MTAMTSQSANPPGVTRTPQQLDDSYKSSYWQHAIEYGLAYYVSGRFAVHAQVFISANLLHHAVELLIKANLSVADSADQIRRYGHRSSYGHSLATSWTEFKARSTDPTLAAHDATVAELDKFENIRYPDRLVHSGGLISVGFAESSPPATPATSGHSMPRYELGLPAIDRLVKLLFDRSGINPEVLRQRIEQQHAARYFRENNATPLL
jgi:hypothetical protein